VTWLDVILVLFIGAMTCGGVRRGLILEFFDWVTLIAAGAAALVLYRPLAMILSFLPWEPATLRMLAFFGVFAVVAGGVMFGGLVLDRNYRHTLGPYVNEVSGPVLAVFKAFLLAYALLLTLSQLPLGAHFRKAQAHAPVVQWVQAGAHPAVMGAVREVASTEAARDVSDTLTRARF